MNIRLRGDFNGLFGDLLCLSHSEAAIDDSGAAVPLRADMEVVVFDEDADLSGQRCFLVASGRVVPAPESLRCLGSRWCLEIDQQGIRQVPTLDQA
jgi:hypothetical protein